MANYSYDPNHNRGYIPGRYVNKVVLLVLMFFLGGFGIHYFYEGKNNEFFQSYFHGHLFLQLLLSLDLLQQFSNQQMNMEIFLFHTIKNAKKKPLDFSRGFVFLLTTTFLDTRCFTT